MLSCHDTFDAHAVAAIYATLPLIVPGMGPALTAYFQSDAFADMLQAAYDSAHSICVVGVSAEPFDYGGAGA